MSLVPESLYTYNLEYLVSICQKVGIDKTIIENWLREKQTFTYDIKLTRLFVNENWELFKDHYANADSAIADLCPVFNDLLLDSLLDDLKEIALKFNKRSRDSTDAAAAPAIDASAIPAPTEEEPSPKRQAIQLSLLHPTTCPLLVDLTSAISSVVNLPDGKKDEPEGQDIEEDNDSSSDYNGVSSSIAAKRNQKKFKLPFTGGIDLNCCQAISLNYNTYIQCRGKLSVKKRKLEEMAAVDPSFPGKICNACFTVFKKKTFFIGFIEDRETIVRDKTVVKFDDKFLRKHFPAMTMEDVANEAIATSKYYDPEWGVSTVAIIFGEQDDEDDEDDEDSGDEEVMESGEC